MISINIRNYTEQDKEKWDSYVEGHPDSTFFHLSGWKHIIETSFKHTPYYLIAEQEGRVRGVFPLFHIKSFLFGSSLVSIPIIVYGGICADDVAVYNELLNEGKKLARQLNVNYLEMKNIKQNDCDLHTKDLYFNFSRVIFKDLDENFNAIPRKQRRMIRVAMKNDLQSHVGRDNLDIFYDIFAHSYRNLGTPVFPLRYLEIIMDTFKKDCRILSVRKNGRTVSAVMTFFFRDTVIPYYAGTLKESFKYAVNDFMYWELMKYGCENGYKMFDFGRSKKGTGSYDFKRHWGFKPEPLPYQYYMVKKKEMPNLNPTNPKFNTCISLWKKLPLSVTKIIGPRIVKLIP